MSNTYIEFQFMLQKHKCETKKDLLFYSPGGHTAPDA